MRHESSVPVLASGVVWLILASPALGEERANAPSHGSHGSHGSNDSNDSPSSDADAALSGLFGSPRVTVDPGVAHLEALMAELSERPAAKTAGKPGLDRARAELSRLRRMIDERADATAIARRKQIVWAALSSSDRQMARAELAAALRTAISRREAAEEQLRAAKVASAAHRAELEAQKVPQTTEPAK